MSTSGDKEFAIFAFGGMVGLILGCVLEINLMITPLKNAAVEHGAAEYVVKNGHLNDHY